MFLRNLPSSSFSTFWKIQLVYFCQFSESPRNFRHIICRICILLIKYAWIMTAYVNWPKRSSHCGSDQFHHAITDRKWGADASGGSAKLAPCNNLLRGAVNMAQEFETRRDSCKPLIIGSQGFSPDSPKSRKLRVDQSSVERVSVCLRWELNFSDARRVSEFRSFQI